MCRIALQTNVDNFNKKVKTNMHVAFQRRQHIHQHHKATHYFHIHVQFEHVLFGNQLFSLKIHKLHTNIK